MFLTYLVSTSEMAHCMCQWLLYNYESRTRWGHRYRWAPCVRRVYTLVPSNFGRRFHNTLFAWNFYRKDKYWSKGCTLILTSTREMGILENHRNAVSKVRCLLVEIREIREVADAGSHFFCYLLVGVLHVTQPQISTHCCLMLLIRMMYLPRRLVRCSRLIAMWVPRPVALGLSAVKSCSRALPE